MSGTPSELATSEMPVSEPGVEDGEATPVAKLPSFPPYPPYSTEVAPPSVAETIIAGHGLRLQHKSVPRKPLKPPPKPAKPRGPKATDVKMAKSAIRAHARCLRKHGAILTDRLEHISKPTRRTIINLWREHAYTLPPETIARLRSMLDADEPFKPDQAYEYFINLRKTRKKATATSRVNAIKKDMLTMVGEKRFVWARNATVAFARGIQQRLSRPGRYALADGMLRLSNIILDDICGYMHMKTPSRRCTHPKARFMMEIADKVAVWIDEILSESDDRMLMMDFDEDDEVERFFEDEVRPEGEPHDKDKSPLLASPAATDGVVTPEPVPGLGPIPVSVPGSPTAEAIPGGTTLAAAIPLAAGTPLDAATPLGDATPLSAATSLAASTPLAAATPLAASTTPQSAQTPATTTTPGDQTPLSTTTSGATTNYFLFTDILGGSKGDDDGFTDEFLDMMSFGEGRPPLLNLGKMKDAFDVLMTEMDQKGDQKLVSHGKFNFTYQEAAKALKDANNFKATEYSVKVANKINNKLTELVKEVTPPELTRNMKDVYDYHFFIRLERAEGLESDHDDPNLSQEIHATMTELVKNQFPEDMKKEMDGIVDVSSKYLSQAAVDDNDRGPVFDFLIKNLIEHGDQPFSDIFPLTTSSAAAHILQTAPELWYAKPDPATVDKMKAALHNAIDPNTPEHMAKDMKRASPLFIHCLFNDTNLSVKRSQTFDLFVHDNGILTGVIEQCANYLSAFIRDREAPDLITHLHIKDIADEGKTNLTKDMKNVTPDALQAPMAGGIAGDRYPKSLLASMEKSMGKKPLYKYRSYGQSYAEAADVLQHGGPSVTPESQQPTEPASDLAQKSLTESKHRLLVSEGLSYDDIHPTKSTKELGFEIATEMKKTLPKQVAPDVAAGLEDTIDKAATQIAKHAGGQGIVEESSKFLAGPPPETNAEKKEVLQDLLAAKGDQILDEAGPYKITYQEAGEALKHAPAGVNKAHDEQKKEEMIKKIEAVLPDKKMAAAYKEPITEGAAHLADVVTGRGEAMEVIQDSLNKKKDKPFLDVGSFKKTHGQIAELLKNAPNLHGEKASPVLMENVEHQLNVLPKEVPADKPLAKQHMKGGLGAQELAELDKSGFNEEAKAASEALRRTAQEDFVKHDKTSGVTSKAKIKDGTENKPHTPDGVTVGPDGKLYSPDGKLYVPDGKVIGPDGKVYGPDGKAHTPDGVTVGPDGKLYSPDGKLYVPDGKVIGPDGKVYGPDGKAHTPDGVTVGPDGKLYDPDGKLYVPDGNVIGPDGKVYGPDGKAHTPDGVTIGPDGKAHTPDGVTVGRDGKLYSPDGKLYVPDCKVIGPDGKVYGPDGKVHTPDGVTVGPDGKLYSPDGKLYVPDGKVIGPDGKVYGPDGKVYTPDGVTVGPDGKLYSPDGKLYVPDGKVIGPDGKVYGPDGKAHTPDGVTVGPDGKLYNPDGKLYVPDGNVIGPDGKVYGPDGKAHTPDGATIGPDGKAHTPDGVTVGRDGKLYSPDGKLYIPDGKVIGPDGKVYGPDGKAHTPDGVTVGPDGKLYSPDGKLYVPVGKVIGPDGKVYGPDGKAHTPDGVTVGRDGKLYSPDGKLYVPDGKVIGPDGKVYGPDGKAHTPDGVTVGPDGKLYSPDGKLYIPDGNVIGPDGKVYGPDGKAHIPDGVTVGPDGKLYSPDGKLYVPGGVMSGPGGVIQDSGVAYGPDGVRTGGSTTYSTASYGPSPESLGYPPLRGETKEQRQRRLAEAEAYRKYEESERRRLGDKEYFRRQEERLRREMEAGGPGKYRGGALGAGIQSITEFICIDYDKEHESALDILHEQLKAHGSEIFYQQPQTILTHAQASEWLSWPMPIKVDEVVKNSTDTARLHKKFEKKLNALVNNVTPPHLADCMQGYNALVNDALISEMQKRGNEILSEVEGAAESYFFASQRLKKVDSLEVQEPCYKIATDVNKKLDDMIKVRPLPRKLNMIMKAVIAEAAALLTSYIMLQGSKTAALNELVQEITKAGDGVLLRHGPLRKSFKEGADLLLGKNADELVVSNPDPVVARKIQIKLDKCMEGKIPPQHMELMNEVIQVCKCYKNVFVQCELWCDEILRRVTRPCCTCSRHVSVQALQDLAPGEILRTTPGSSRVFAPGVEISIAPCPKMAKRKRKDSPAASHTASPTSDNENQNPITSYVMYSTSHKRFGYDSMQASTSSCGSPSRTPMSLSPLQLSKRPSPVKAIWQDIHTGNVNFYQQQQEQMQAYEAENKKRLHGDHQPSVSEFSSSSNNEFGQSSRSESPVNTCLSPQLTSPMISNIHMSDTSKICSSSRTPITSTDQMADWHAMMVSLMWNLQAWRDWIQEIFDHALTYHNTPSTRDTWSSFQRRITTEALQWRQYSVFCHQLTTRLHTRYKDKEVMCNAEVRWVAWRAGAVDGRTVKVAPGVYVGRVHYRGNHLLGAVYEPHYRCHVVIFGRPFAFNCYELLMLTRDEETFL
ncbi:hypothetical protein HF086_004680 [Spodoptera exigua]|uniref:Uncharacterized protein n=1 Tax=Spodoptera exigua TaxID=7107 RepID=A0A922SBT7_SPOEX|nr:hypothetical protein HF086_004680 [Spodoptera exigua]